MTRSLSKVLAPLFSSSASPPAAWLKVPVPKQSLIVIAPDGEVAKRYGTIESLIVLIDETGIIRFKNSLWHDYHPFVTEQIEYLLKPQE